MSTRFLTLSLVVAGAVCLSVHPARAQSLVYQSDLYLANNTDLLLANYNDQIYDFDVYAADPDPVTGYFIVVLYRDGSEEEFGPYASRSSAEYSLFFMVEHGQLSGAIDAEIVARALPPKWVFMRRFDKRAAAVAYADLLESVGLLTDIRVVWGAPWR
jgi:hypothetical protein